MQYITNLINGTRISTIPSIKKLHKEIKISDERKNWIITQRKTIDEIIQGKDRRLLVIIGPCSIHDKYAALDYAVHLSKIIMQYNEKLYIVMRTYFEKPRTRNGWKGLMVDPDINFSYDVEKGIKTSRNLLKEIIEMNIPTATEFLDPFLTPYISDLICWGAIGARTVESQPHRQLASGLTFPVGFKNSTDGNILVAVDAIIASRCGQLFYSPDERGNLIAILTNGNTSGHLILRGGVNPNYYVTDILQANKLLNDAGINQKIIIDCSHGNSGKKALRQLKIACEIVRQRNIQIPVAGIMIESFLSGGHQSENNPKKKFGQSITDECLSWTHTEYLLKKIARLCN